ncbi:hypothetical protein BJ912DRAFT_920815 [Pholiota molesta]|nr:hypothetical protein BJ912DRAFT_920815 [Pholiota molesta]
MYEFIKFDFLPENYWRTVLNIFELSFIQFLAMSLIFGVNPKITTGTIVPQLKNAPLRAIDVANGVLDDGETTGNTFAGRFRRSLKAEINQILVDLSLLSSPRSPPLPPPLDYPLPCQSPPPPPPRRATLLSNERWVGSLPRRRPRLPYAVCPSPPTRDVGRLGSSTPPQRAPTTPPLAPLPSNEGSTSDQQARRPASRNGASEEASGQRVWERGRAGGRERPRMSCGPPWALPSLVGGMVWGWSGSPTSEGHSQRRDGQQGRRRLATARRATTTTSEDSKHERLPAMTTDGQRGQHDADHRGQQRPKQA